MTKVKSISIEGSSPTPIVDKGIDEAQTRSTVSVTDVVKVQDGNGVWHAIPFNKFMEVATPLVASIMNNVNLQGNIKKFLGLDANGNPGVSTIADAASVLGVPLVKTLSSPNANSLPTTPQLAIYFGTFSNSFSGSQIYILQAYIESNNILQLGFYFGNSTEGNAIYSRRKFGSEWGEWRSV